MFTSGNAPSAGDTFIVVDFDFDVAIFILICDIGCFHRAFADTTVATGAQIEFSLNDIPHIGLPPAILLALIFKIRRRALRDFVSARPVRFSGKP
jgi:hypothetical protein